MITQDFRIGIQKRAEKKEVCGILAKTRERQTILQQTVFGSPSGVAQQGGQQLALCMYHSTTRRAKDVEKQYDSFGPLLPVEDVFGLLA